MEVIGTTLSRPCHCRLRTLVEERHPPTRTDNQLLLSRLISITLRLLIMVLTGHFPRADKWCGTCLHAWPAKFELLQECLVVAQVQAAWYLVLIVFLGAVQCCEVPMLIVLVVIAIAGHAQSSSMSWCVIHSRHRDRGRYICSLFRLAWILYMSSATVSTVENAQVCPDSYPWGYLSQELSISLRWWEICPFIWSVSSIRRLQMQSQTFWRLPLFHRRVFTH